MNRAAFSQFFVTELSIVSAKIFRKSSLKICLRFVPVKNVLKVLNRKQGV